ncbi:hypothetical protein HLB23_12645 [Nocardia uniformis]|uniref:Uncharacterized protein n=1 Tax=Nocardia uniformis TaxID=53432 RepID=A0A849BVT5_9NOCA|nr:hypothetical protein [Nocardia uniformis]NNH70703.1 hypothetical protein [Nocardia uniformis]
MLSDAEFTEFVTALGQLLTRFSSNERRNEIPPTVAADLPETDRAA